jgi:hypothetical protein
VAIASIPRGFAEDYPAFRQRPPGWQIPEQFVDSGRAELGKGEGIAGQPENSVTFST